MEFKIWKLIINKWEIRRKLIINKWEVKNEFYNLRIDNWEVTRERKELIIQKL